MKPHYSNEVARVLLCIDKFSKLFARATLCDLQMQAVSPTALATSAFLFGLYAAMTTSKEAAPSKEFSPKEVLVVGEAWRNVARELISPYSEEEMEQFMIEIAYRLAHMRQITKGCLNGLFPQEMANLLPDAEEIKSFGQTV